MAFSGTVVAVIDGTFQASKCGEVSSLLPFGERSTEVESGRQSRWLTFRGSPLGVI